MKPCSRTLFGRCGGYRLPDCPLGCLIESGGWRAVACCLLLLPAGDVCGDSPEPPIQLGSRRELMLDDYLFSSLKNLQFRLHSPRLAEKVLDFDAPWEGRRDHGISVVGYPVTMQDGDRFRLYYASYLGLRFKPADPSAQFTGYLQSKDGRHWPRVDLNRVEFAGSKRNNILRQGGSTSHNFAPFIDRRPGVSDAQRYKAVGGNGRAYAFASADGLEWEKLRDSPIVDGDEAAFDQYGAIRWGNNPGKERAILDSLNVAFWDSARGHYALYFRAYLPALRRAGDEIQGVIRSVMRATSDDFLDWSNIEPIEFGEPRRFWKHELYTTALRPYHRAPHLLIGFPLRTVPRRPLRGTSFGLSESALMFSRDGKRFSLFDEPLMPPGRDVRNWSKHGNMIAWGMLATAPDELSIYFLQHDHQPTTHLRRGTLRTDGFVSLRAVGFPGGTAVTHPLVFEGNRLEINAATGAAGGISVAILDAITGKPIAGYEQSQEFFGDQISHVVHWKGRNAIGSLAGRAIRLKFTLFHADLFSLRFFEES
ncbi:MAG: hypothetical protein CMJ70_00780 [Planctomycetaceae bacterium]|nr:hypothetical protein [Planctomycetaceae bacterium]